MNIGTSRFTRSAMAIVLLGTILVGATLVSAVLADTASPEQAQTTPITVNLRDGGASPFLDVATEAAASALAMPADEVADRIAGGASLKRIADAQEVGYGAIASAVDKAVSAALDRAVGDGSLTHRRAAAIDAAVGAWIDAGGQPNTDWFPAPA